MLILYAILAVEVRVYIEQILKVNLMVFKEKL